MMQLWRDILHVLGVDDVSGPWYAFFSGFGSDVSEFGILIGLIGLWRHHTCEVAGCWRFGRHKTDGGHVVCRRHHPDGAPTAEDVAEAHREAQNR